MSITWILDTNIVSKALRGGDGTRERLQARPRGDFAISAVTLAELAYGSHKAPHPERTRRRWQAFVAGLPILSFDAPAAEHHATLRWQLRHAPIGERDLLIAAIALANDCGVVTNNVREFQRVPDLRWEDWSG